MRSIFVFTASALLLCAAHARGSAIVSVSGPVFGGAGIGGLAEGWSMSSGDNVSVAGHFVNGNGLVTATGNTAYLISGSLPSLANAFASTNFTLPGNYDGMFMLFSGVSLSAGSYWICVVVGRTVLPSARVTTNAREYPPLPNSIRSMPT